MLEGYFVKPSTIDRVRASWLAPQIERYVEWMHTEGYADRSVLHQVPILCHFADFATHHGATDLSSAAARVEMFASQWVARSTAGPGSTLPRPKFLDEVRNPVRQMLRVALEGRVTCPPLPEQPGMESW
jgi:integrase/recombinase XerD